MARKPNIKKRLERAAVRCESSSEDDDLTDSEFDDYSSACESSHDITKEYEKVSSDLAEEFDAEQDDKTFMPQSAEALLSDLLSHRDEIQCAIMDSEYDELIGSPCACNEEGKRRLYRCFDCARVDVMCDTCLLRLHVLSPFHWVEEWTGQYFKRVELKDLGHVIFMNHRGHPCPANEEQLPYTLTVTDVNGVHNCRVVYCRCVNKEAEFIQLLRFGLFPASAKQPQVAFTIRVLRDFHIHTTVSKKSGYDYLVALRKKTNNYIPFTIQTAQFMRIAHFWRFLAAERRSGQLHGLKDEVINRPKGSFAVPCLACPVPGFNTSATLSNHYKDSKFLIVDANFHLINLNKRNNTEEKELWAGRGWMMPRVSIQEHIKEFGDIPEEKSTCSNFQAIENANNVLKHRGQSASGLVVFLCRHACCEPGSAVSLQRGERHINVDLGLSAALRNLKGIRNIKLCYDIICQYSVNLAQRFKRCFPEQESLICNSLDYYIGTFHAYGHKDSCQYRFGLPHGEGVGRTDGEEVERFWSEMNQVAGSTKQMGPGHRADTLDDFSSAANWSKMEAMARALYRKWSEAKGKKDEFESAFTDFDTEMRRRYSDGIVLSWASMDTSPHKNVDGEWTSVYRLETKDPSLRKTSRKKTKDSSLHPKTIDSLEDFVLEAILIQRDQRELRTIVNEEKIDSERKALVELVDRWLTTLSVYMPHVAMPKPEIRSRDVEKVDLCLPSSFTKEERHNLRLEHIAAVEIKFRQGEAYDALEDLRQSIGALESINAMKSKYTHGKATNTRTARAKAVAAEWKHIAMTHYRYAYRCLLALGIDTSVCKLQPLTDDDAYRPSIAIPHELGTGDKSLSWIWTVGGDGIRHDISRNTIEENRVLWFRSRAQRDRWREELVLVQEESRRLVRGFEKWESIWSTATAEQKEIGRLGKAAFAARKASVFHEMADNARAELREHKVDDKAVHRTPPKRRMKKRPKEKQIEGGQRLKRRKQEHNK